MKLSTRFTASLVASLATVASASAAISVAITPPVTAAGTTGVGAFVFEVLEAQLSGKADYDLVDRKRLSDMLAEQSLGAAGLTQDQASKVGKLVGAKYYILGMHFTPLPQQVDFEHGRLSANHGGNAGLVFD